MLTITSTLPAMRGSPPSLPAISDALPFREVWAVDFEFGSEPGERPEPLCLVAWELKSGRKIRLWRDRFGVMPPYRTDAEALFVAYYASAEIGCHLALGWPVPERALDLFTEFRNHTNGLPTISGAGLIGALAFHGLDGIGAVEKEEMRDLVLRGGPWSDAERSAILKYCESDVEALSRLLSAMLPKIDLPRALLRGRYWRCSMGWENWGSPAGSANRQFERANCCDCIGKPIVFFGAGRMRQLITPCSGAAYRPSLAGAYEFRPTPTRGPCGTSRCKPMAPRCCGWRVASRRSAASKCARQSTTRF
jgi:hypothetical protein